MAERSRYNVSVKDIGVDREVFKNKLGIKDQKILDDAETLLLADTHAYYFEQLEQNGLDFNRSLLFEIHAYFLGTLYSWAGQVRRINISKDDILFAPVEYLEKQLTDFDRRLKRHVPALKESKTIIAEKLAWIHNELNALHPFREGNGRTIRLFLDLLAAYVGYDPIEWDRVDDKKYILACKMGMGRDHVAMKMIIFAGLHKKKRGN